MPFRSFSFPTPGIPPSSNGTTVYLAGQDDIIYLKETHEKYFKKYEADGFAIFTKLRSFQKRKPTINDFRTNMNDGVSIIKEEGGEDMTALYYTSPKDGEDNQFRIYCIWPVLENQKILIVGGGGIKDSDGPFQKIAELKKANSLVINIKEILQYGLKHNQVKISNNKLSSQLPNLIVKN